MKRKGYTANELAEMEESNRQLVSEEIATNVRVQACDVEKDMFPQYDILDGTKTTVLALALPGYDIKRFDIDLQDGILSISAYDDSCKKTFLSSSCGAFEMKRHGIRTGAFARVFDVDPAAKISRMWKEDGVFFLELTTDTSGYDTKLWKN